MEALNSREGNNHPHRPPTPLVLTDTREVVERLPSEMVHLHSTITLSIIRATPIMLQTASTNHQSWRWSLCLTLVGMRLHGGCIFTRVIPNSASHTRHSWKGSKCQICIFKMHCYATWKKYLFFKVSLPRWSRMHTIVGSLDISK